MQKSAGWILSDVCQILHMHYSSLLARQLQLNKLNRGVVVVLVETHTLYLAVRCLQYDFNCLICVLCHEYLKPSKVDTNVKLENGPRCLHESGCGFSSATVSAARSAGDMRCSNAFTQFNMLLEKSQHTWFGWAMQEQHSKGRGPPPTP